MTSNEKIAEKMGWDSDSQGLHVLETWDEQPEYNKLYLVKLLQQRMVDDGWEFHLSQLKTRYGLVFRASAYYDTMRYFYVFAATEPAAIVELFCKVYGIEDK
jgi:hypothetical protein